MRTPQRWRQIVWCDSPPRAGAAFERSKEAVVDAAKRAGTAGAFQALSYPPSLWSEATFPPHTTLAPPHSAAPLLRAGESAAHKVGDKLHEAKDAVTDAAVKVNEKLHSAEEAVVGAVTGTAHKLQGAKDSAADAVAAKANDVKKK